MTQVTQVNYTHIREHRAKPRLWIEGVKLSIAGMKRDDRYDVIEMTNSLKLVPNSEGKYKVSGRKRHGRDIPIIDCGLPMLAEKFGLNAKVRVVFSHGGITVTLHHETQAQRERETHFIQNLNAGRVTEASLFTGGAISTTSIAEAIAACGFASKVSWVVDMELKYLQAAEKNSFAITDDTAFYVGRSEEIEPEFLRAVNVLSFSMPCSGYSLAGSAKHKLTPEEHDGATSLFGTLNAIKSANPAVLVSENVTQAKGSPAYTMLIAELKRMGYVIRERIFSSEHTGSMENRPRYWFFAVSQGLADIIDLDMALDFSPSACRYRNLGELIEPNIPESAWADNQYLKDKQERDAKAGKGFAKRQLKTESDTSVGTIGRHYMKRRSTEPFMTREDGKERLFTFIEHARLKSTPESLVAGLSATVAHEILGQGIDYLQAYLPIKQLFTVFKRTFVKSTPDTVHHLQPVMAL